MCCVCQFLHIPFGYHISRIVMLAMHVTLLVFIFSPDKHRPIQKRGRHVYMYNCSFKCKALSDLCIL